MSVIAPLFVVQILTTGLQPEGLLSTQPEKHQIHKCRIGKELCGGREWCTGFNDRIQTNRADNSLRLPALRCLQSE